MVSCKTLHFYLPHYFPEMYLGIYVQANSIDCEIVMFALSFLDYVRLVWLHTASPFGPASPVSPLEPDFPGSPCNKQ